MTARIPFLVVTCPLNLLDGRDTGYLRHALSRAERVVVFLDGANMARSSHKFPFTVAERKEMLAVLFKDAVASGGLLTVAADHNPYDEAAVAQALGNEVAGIAARFGIPRHGEAFRVAERGDRPSPASLAAFGPPRAPAAAELSPPAPPPPATLRDYLLTGEAAAADPRLSDWLEAFAGTQDHAWLRQEAEFCVDYAKQWPLPEGEICFRTADSVSLCAGKVLMVVRGAMPGKGLWALPGGFINKGEKPSAAARRERGEETGDVADDDCLGTRLYAAQGRDPRGVIETYASVFDMAPLPPQTTENGEGATADEDGRPLVEGRDDARSAEWKWPGDLEPHTVFGDHGLIIEDMVMRFRPEQANAPSTRTAAAIPRSREPSA
jgi:bifunctional NMN adenylyltransferase/nudix hydrolase